MPELLAEGPEPRGVGEVWVYSGRSPDTFVDITPVMEKKKQALRLRRSQIEEGLLAVMEGIDRGTAARAPEPRPAFADSYTVVRSA